MLKDQQKLMIVMYHYTRDLQHSRYPGIKGLDIGLMREQMAFFREKYSVVRMEDVIAAVYGKFELPNNALLLTFDDGYIDNYTYAFPILEEFGFQGSFFIPGKTFDKHQLLDVNKIHYILASAGVLDISSELRRRMDFYRGSEFDFPSTEELWDEYAVEDEGYFDDGVTVFVKRMLQTVLPERLRNIIASELFEKYVGISEEQLAYELYMTREQVNVLKKHGMYIGVHGYDHYWLNNIDTKQMHNDITKALDVLDGLIDRKEWVINYPYGAYNDEVIDFCKSSGACLGLTTEIGIFTLGKTDAFKAPRLDCNDFPPKSENYKNR